MNESTQLSYGNGYIIVDIESESITEVAPTGIRLGDYNEVATACFTEKELEMISEGATAHLEFGFVMSDELATAEAAQAFDETLVVSEERYGDMSTGVYYEVTLEKAVGDEDFARVEELFEEIEFLYEIPLYLYSPDKYYYMMTYSNGGCDFCADLDTESDDLTIRADRIGNAVMLVQDQEDRLVDGKAQGPKVGAGYLFIGGIAVLAFIWWSMDHFRKNR